MERLKILFESGALPFLLATGTNHKWSIVRVMESVIIAIIGGIIAGGVAVYVTSKVLENDIGHIMKIQGEIKQDSRDWYKEFRNEIKDVRKDIYNHVKNHTNDKPIEGG